MRLLTSQFDYTMEHVRRARRQARAREAGTQTCGPQYATVSVQTESMHWSRRVCRSAATRSAADGAVCGGEVSRATVSGAVRREAEAEEDKAEHENEEVDDDEHVNVKQEDRRNIRERGSSCAAGVHAPMETVAGIRAEDHRSEAGVTLSASSLVIGSAGPASSTSVLNAVPAETKAADVVTPEASVEAWKLHLRNAEGKLLKSAPSLSPPMPGGSDTGIKAEQGMWTEPQAQQQRVKDEDKDDEETTQARAPSETHSPVSTTRPVSIFPLPPARMPVDSRRHTGHDGQSLTTHNNDSIHTTINNNNNEEDTYRAPNGHSGMGMTECTRAQGGEEENRAYATSHYADFSAWHTAHPFSTSASSSSFSSCPMPTSATDIPLEESVHMSECHVTTHPVEPSETWPLSAVAADGASILPPPPSDTDAVHSRHARPHSSSSSSSATTTTATNGSFTKCFIPLYQLPLNQHDAFRRFLQTLPIFAEAGETAVEAAAMGVTCVFACAQDAADFLRARFIEFDGVALTIYPLHDRPPRQQQEEESVWYGGGLSSLPAALACVTRGDKNDNDNGDRDNNNNVREASLRESTRRRHGRHEHHDSLSSSRHKDTTTSTTTTTNDSNTDHANHNSGHTSRKHRHGSTRGRSTSLERRAGTLATRTSYDDATNEVERARRHRRGYHHASSSSSLSSAAAPLMSSGMNNVGHAKSMSSSTGLSGRGAKGTGEERTRHKRHRQEESHPSHTRHHRRREGDKTDDDAAHMRSRRSK